MGIVPEACTDAVRTDLSQLSAAHSYGPDGERIQIRNLAAGAALVATLTPEAAAALSAVLDRGVAGTARFAEQLDQAVAGAVYATVARIYADGAR